MNPLLEQFLVEARENLAFIDQHIEQIGGDDPELLNAVFRAAHTLKGGSGIVGFDAVKNITHHAEDLLDMLRAGKIPFHHSMIESLYNAFDEVMNLIEAAEESGDIVEADEARIEAISQELSTLMGKEVQSVAVWNRPFALIEDIERIVNLPMPFLSTLPPLLPFKIETFDEAACKTPQLYAIVFDVDESCMLYGNDPLYALSLLGEGVVGIHSCMGEQSVISVLSGMDDPEGLLLRLQLSAFVYATYDEINDALFNFSDEISLYPLDVATLLGVSEGKGEHELDVLKELYHEVASSLRSRNREAIADKVSKSLQLIGNETLQSTQLKRLYTLLGAIETEDLGQLESFFEQLPQGKIYRYAQRTGSDEATPEECAESSVAEAPIDIVMDDLLRAQLEALLAQQLMALERVDESSVTERVGMFLEGYIRPFVPTMPGRFENRETMIQWIRGELGLEESEEKPTVAATLPEPTLPHTPAVPAPAKKGEEKPLESLSLVVTLSQSSEVSEPQERNAAELTKKSVIGKTVKIDQESIDNLMNIVGELLVAKNSLPYLAEGVHSMSSEGIRRAIMEKYTFINRLAEQLQDLIMSMRMLPISYVFDRYPKLVRDISKNLGKKVNLTMEGGETKLDKNMIEMLADPMIHIMRNSLDHGIESPEIRAQKGKNPEGLITLNAYAQSDKILIEIKDDGAGINIDRVVQKVLEKNLLTLDQIDALSDDEKASLVMLPGLSTAETISEYSGRGVGMDVVKKSIENFGGTIRIKTVANKGTTIILSIPVSLAVTSLLHVTMSGVHYGFPMDSVSETVKIDHDAIEYLQNEPFVYIRGEVIPLLFVKSMLNEAALIGKALPIVVLNIKGNRLAVAVNELLGQLDVVQKPLEGIMENHPIFSGTALLGNGQIIMALDPLGMLGISHVLKSERKKAS
ncbi:MAG: chemotaxis protein CheA [Sulfuricurvum sp.]|jgi:two-component system chemotaxis sensor kinase CheA|uniref:chemotaxis protein CheA n=1 Tax=Sulfuricurvum sp. TaxID=2025608 RepID=UPI0025F2FEF6|nr:chemotaxis protein CheA [Sulfuricurvum sp.]MCK9371843.1 chemotaxis protein CheA [Sulfuricurvum sp.]